jgi:hypothetical protein
MIEFSKHILWHYQNSHTLSVKHVCFMENFCSFGFLFWENLTYSCVATSAHAPHLSPHCLFFLPLPFAFPSGLHRRASLYSRYTCLSSGSLSTSTALDSKLGNILWLRHLCSLTRCGHILHFYTWVMFT